MLVCLMEINRFWAKQHEKGSILKVGANEKGRAEPFGSAQKMCN